MYEFLEFRVDDVMTHDVVTLREDATVCEAEALFEVHDVDALPVVDRERRLIGIVTKLDLLAAFRFQTSAPIPSYDSIMAGSIAPVLNANPSIVEPHTPLTRVLEKLVATGVKSFPVVREEKLVGIVAREDVLRGIRRAASGKAQPLGVA